MLFTKLAEYLQKLEGTASRNEMTVILAQLFREASPEDARLIAYLSAGRLGPAYDSPDTGVADKMMLKALGDKANELFKKLGDLGLVIQEIKSIRAGEYKSLSIKDVYDRLGKIAEVAGTGSQEAKQKMIADLLAELDPISAKYVVKIILGKLRTGFSDMTVLDSLSWMLAGDKSLRKNIENIYNVRADLGEVANLIKSGRVEELKSLSIDPKIGTPVLMAKAERATTPGEIWDRMDKCALEYKLDGLRIQAHVKRAGERESIRLFSRGMENVTHMYPDIVEGLQKQLTKDCIVEGEMIAVGTNGRFLPFQETVQRKRKYDISEMSKKVPLKIYLFDVLMISEKNVMNEPNEKRRDLLMALVKMGETVKIMPRIMIKDHTEIEAFFEMAINDGTEGVMAKKLDGVYQAGARDFNWIKYKKSYAKSTMADTIDAVVMGYDYGQGKRQQFGIGDFLIGVYDPKNDKYLTIAKVGTGLTDEEWRDMKIKCQMSNVKSKPENYEVSKQMNCDHWVSPKIVVEILADEITKSPMHSSGWALRFPRLISFRDKKPQDATTIAELASMLKLQQNGR